MSLTTNRPGARGRAKILVVDDDPKIASALSIRLRAAGYQVLTAPDGAEALRMAKCDRPDLIVLDVWLPLIDIWMPLGVGFSVARRLKNRGLGGIPIIFLTASREPGLKEAAQSAHAAGFFEKPYDSEELLEAIARILQEQDGRTSELDSPTRDTHDDPASASLRKQMTWSTTNGTP